MLLLLNLLLCFCRFSLHTYTSKGNKHNINHLQSVENDVEKSSLHYLFFSKYKIKNTHHKSLIFSSYFIFKVLCIYSRCTAPI